MRRQTVDVPGIYAPAGDYSHAIVVSGGRTVYLSGVVGKRPDGSVPISIEEQAELAFQNLAAVMAAAGGSLEDIVRTNIYVGADFSEHAASLRAIRARYLQPAFPVSTLVRVAGFAGPEYLFEIEATAVLPD